MPGNSHSPYLLPHPRPAKDILGLQRLNLKPFFLSIPTNKTIRDVAVTCNSLFSKNDNEPLMYTLKKEGEGSTGHMPI